jgi:ArsR family transcriptional regulator, arsenate/arsenite/antimonite-responsive transcriptional repressor
LQLHHVEEKNNRRYFLQAEIFKALAHPVRIHMLEKLRDRPWCVCELAAELGVEKSVASKHLSLLRSVGLIDDSKRGTLVEYRLVAPCILDMTACAETAVLANLRRRLEVPPVEAQLTVR